MIRHWLTSATVLAGLLGTLGSVPDASAEERGGMESVRVASSAPLDRSKLAAVATTASGAVRLLFSGDSGRSWTSGPSISLAAESRRFSSGGQFEAGPWLLGDGRTMLAAFNDRLRRSVDGGVTWTESRHLPGTSSEFHLTVDPLRPDEAWFCEDRTTAAINWHTGDAGTTWQRRGRHSDRCRPQAIQPAGSHVLLAGEPISPADGWISRSTDDGRSWSRARGTSSRFVPDEDLAFDPERPNVAVVAATDLHGVRDPDQQGRWSIWRTTDAGATWTRVWRVPTYRCNRLTELRCGSYSRGGAPRMVFGGDRFVIGPLTRSGIGLRSASLGAVYLVSSRHGLDWRLIRAPYADQRRPLESMPSTGFSVSTADGLVAQETPRSRTSGQRLWRLRSGSNRWVSEPFALD
ncbi:MAG TPA: hypothetical protein VHA54_07895 [Solirubrobacterales bacterium]|nr:hypothetical protein [Solirubrobacterales bacterium]